MSEPVLALESPADLENERAQLRCRLADANINPHSFLATDYLNHFNEIIMLLDMVPEMPECFEDIGAWRPKAYTEHFRDSGFSNKDLAIAAYEIAPEEWRTPFDATIDTINTVLSDGLAHVAEVMASGDADILKICVEQITNVLRKLIDAANAIINNSSGVVDQADIDNILKS